MSDCLSLDMRSCPYQGYFIISNKSVSSETFANVKSPVRKTYRMQKLTVGQLIESSIQYIADNVIGTHIARRYAVIRNYVCYFDGSVQETRLLHC